MSPRHYLVDPETPPSSGGALAPNRLAVILGLLTPAGAALVTLLGAFENDIAKAIVCGVALLCAAAVLIVFILGWQKYEERVGDGVGSVDGVPIIPSGTPEGDVGEPDPADDIPNEPLDNVALADESPDVSGADATLPLMPPDGPHSA